MPAPTPSATITIVIDQFRPLGSVFPIDVSMSMPPTQGITLDQENITITAVGKFNLTFSLPNPQYVLLGAAFAAYDAKQHQTDVGLGEFPTVTINRSATAGSSLTVADNGSGTARYNYLLLVQNAATGSIGIIDPGIRNQP